MPAFGNQCPSYNLSIIPGIYLNPRFRGKYIFEADSIMLILQLKLKP
jgi:hypothetical protein